MSLAPRWPKTDNPMRVAVVGVGQIGATLATRFAAAGHEVCVANSRTPATIRPFADSIGARALHAAEAVQGADVVVVSVPFGRLAELRTVMGRVADGVAVVDTSNFFPHRDGAIPGVADAAAESLWVSELWGKPVVKAWNSILAGSLLSLALPTGTEDRIALPVSGDQVEQVARVLQLVDDSGFDGVFAGPIAESWRHQPGASAYTTDLRREDLLLALVQADRESLPARRDEMVRAIRGLDGWGSYDQRLRIAKKIFLREGSRGGRQDGRS